MPEANTARKSGATKNTKSKKKTVRRHKLIIVESPVKAETIGKFVGRGYKVIASNGHIRDLPKSRLGIDADDHFKPHYITIRGRSEVLNALRKEAKNASMIYLATDPDREGEAISWHLATLLNIDPSTPCRISFNEITAKAVRAALEKPRPLDMDLVNAQQARRILDRLVGYSISPILWDKVRKGLSAGRVQSAAARLVCDRELEIDAFVPQEYWTLQASVRVQGTDAPFMLNYSAADNDKLTDAAQVQSVLARIEKSDQPGKIMQVKTGEMRKKPQPPFTTSMLQQEASRKLGITIKRIMLLAQQLHEGIQIEGNGQVGLISYIRTDSVRVSEEAQAQAAQCIKDRYGERYLPETPNQYKGAAGAQDAHEAIRPTSLELTPESVQSSLTRDQLRLYKLIYNRFLASQMSGALYKTFAVQADIAGHAFRAQNAKLEFSGYLAVYQESREDEDEAPNEKLPALEAGQLLDVLDTDAQQHFTEPPRRYTESTLVRALEEKGIGRPSTYATIISTILDRGYVQRENKALRPTELGMIVIDIMKGHFADIVDIAFTAEMEHRLDAVEEGEAEYERILADFYGPLQQEIRRAEQEIERMHIPDEESEEICEKCGSRMVIKMGRFGKFLACPRFPECRNAKPFLEVAPAPCPLCGARLVLRKSKKGRSFYGCEKYPECSFITSYRPSAVSCATCGGLTVQRKRQDGTPYLKCNDPACAAEMDAPEEDNE